MFVHNRRDTGQFARRKTVVPFELNGLQPEFGALGFPLNVNVRRSCLSLENKKNLYGPARRTVGVTPQRLCRRRQRRSWQPRKPPNVRVSAASADDRIGRRPVQTLVRPRVELAGREPTRRFQEGNSLRRF